MATRRLLHGHGLLPDLLAQRGQPGVLVAQPEQPEQEASRQQNDSREHGEQENHHQLPPPRRKFWPVEYYFAPASASWASSCAARKYLFFPRSPTVLMLNACLRRSASPSLTPCRALTGALRISASDLFSQSLSRKAPRFASTATVDLQGCAMTEAQSMA